MVVAYDEDKVLILQEKCEVTAFEVMCGGPPCVDPEVRAIRMFAWFGVSARVIAVLLNLMILYTPLVEHVEAIDEQTKALLIFLSMLTQGLSTKELLCRFHLTDKKHLRRVVSMMMQCCEELESMVLV